MQRKTDDQVPPLYALQLVKEEVFNEKVGMTFNYKQLTA